MKPVIYVPPDIGTTVLAMVILLAAVAKFYWYRRTRNLQAIAEAVARICVALFYLLISYASVTEFGQVFTSDHWRIYSRWAILGLFLVEVIPWLIEMIKSYKSKGARKIT